MFQYLRFQILLLLRFFMAFVTFTFLQRVHIRDSRMSLLLFWYSFQECRPILQNIIQVCFQTINP